jgi:hypothetical protein
VRCALCHDDLAEPLVQRCGGCGTLLHDACAAGLAGCPTLGCARAAPRRGATLALGVRPRETGQLWSAVRTACATLAVVALLAAGVVSVAIREYQGTVEWKHARVRLRQADGVDLAIVTSQARALHARLAPTAERRVAAGELPGFPAVHDAARGGVVAWPDGVVLYLDAEPYLSRALVVLARPEPLSPAVEERLSREVHVELAARFVELEPGVYERGLVR